MEKYIPFVDMNEIIKKGNAGRGVTLLDEANGCVAGCRAGITFYDETEYGKGGVHEDQEGFLVLEGNGMAKIGDNEFEVYPGIAFMAPAGVWHVLKSTSASKPVKVFWFHSAI